MSRRAYKATLLTVAELETDRELRAAFPLMAQLRARLTNGAEFRAQVRRQRLEGYRLFGGYLGPRLVTLAGVRRSHTLARGEHLFVDDLVTAPAVRGQGHGRATLRALAERCLAEGVSLICLDSRDTALGFYQALGFEAQSSVPCRIAARRLSSQQAAR